MKNEFYVDLRKKNLNFDLSQRENAKLGAKKIMDYFKNHIEVDVPHLTNDLEFPHVPELPHVNESEHNAPRRPHNPKLPATVELPILPELPTVCETSNAASLPQELEHNNVPELPEQPPLPCLRDIDQCCKVKK